MATVKKIPERMCVLCKQMKPKTQLIRIVNAQGNVVVDKTGKINGRGVYLCKCKDCITKAVKKKNFAKQHGFELTEQIVAELESLIEQ